MASIVQQQPWKDAAIIKSEVITDSWEVAKAWTGRAAEVVLFVCMIANIIEMLPSVNLPTVATNTVLGVQVVMLDVGGFSLATMAYHARQQGNEQVARKALSTAYVLIAVMMITLLLVTVGILFPELRQYTNMGEKFLILGRVILTVWYGHVVHSLRGTIVKTISLASHEETITGLIEAHNQQVQMIQNTMQSSLIEHAKNVELLRQENAQLHVSLGEISALLVAQIEAQKAHDLATETPREEQEIDTGEYATISIDNATANATKTHTITRSEKALKAARIIRRNPQITAPELAKKADISPSYARQLLTKKSV